MSDVRVVGATVVADADRVLRDAELAYSPTTGRVTYLGPVRGAPGPADLPGAGGRILHGTAGPPAAPRSVLVALETRA